MKVLIDGDACPVKEIIYQETANQQISVTLVTSLSHHTAKPLPEHVNVIYVDEGADSADYRIVALIKKGDVLITQDYGLASLVLAKKVRVLHHLGYEYTHANIEQLLESRHISAQLRKGGQRTKGPKKFTEEDQQAFRNAFQRLLLEEKNLEKE